MIFDTSPIALNCRYPTTVSHSAALCGLSVNDDACSFNFIFSNKDRSSYSCQYRCIDRMLEPADAQISKVVVYERNSTLWALQFFTSDGTCCLKGGRKRDLGYCDKREITIKEGYKIVGFTSDISTDAAQKAQH